jgi:hypothetical protein
LTDADPRPMSDARPAAADDHASMTRNRNGRKARPTDEDRRFFDALVFLRGLYAERGPQDATPTESIANAIAAVNGSFQVSLGHLP